MTLHCIMIKDLPESFQSSLALFEDDLCFWEVGNNIEKLNKMAQNSLGKIEVWSDENLVTISNTKSTAILFTKKRKNEKITFTFNGISIETSKQIKYLGAIFKKMGFLMLI